MFRDPLPEERCLGEQLLGNRVEIYWDGDDVFYPAIVNGFNHNSSKHSVIYDNDDSGIIYEEDFSSNSSVWRIWDDTMVGADEKVSLDSSRLYTLYLVAFKDSI